MQPSQLPAGSYRIRLFTGATATAVESAINTYLKGEEVSLAGFYMTHDGTAPVVKDGGSAKAAHPVGVRGVTVAVAKIRIPRSQAK